MVQVLQKKMEDNNFSGQFHPLECDLTNENDIFKAFKWIDENIGGIHFLINNAGIVRFSPILSKNKQ
jgi:short-subunit dehydrogenase